MCTDIILLQILLLNYSYLKYLNTFSCTMYSTQVLRFEFCGNIHLDWTPKRGGIHVDLEKMIIPEVEYYN